MPAPVVEDQARPVINELRLTKVRIPVNRRGLSAPMRFHMGYSIDPNTKCWVWAGISGKTRYGRFKLDGTSNGVLQMGPHRYSWMIHYGPILDGLAVCHKCDNPKCVNPEHLFLGTQKDNLQDAIQKGRTLKGSLNSNSRLTEGMVLEIRSSRDLLRILAKKYGVTMACISAIQKRRSWKHI